MPSSLDKPAGRCTTASILDFAFRSNPLDLIDRDHAVQDRMCALLEEIADGLPDNVGRAQADAAVAALKHHVATHILDEEHGLFPLLRRWAHPQDNVDAVLTLLSHEHERDLDFAHEIIDALEDLVVAGSPRNADMLGYMLRGFFEMQRRHNAWENALVLPLARRRLPQEALEALMRAMRTNRSAPAESAWPETLVEVTILR